MFGDAICVPRNPAARQSWPLFLPFASLIQNKMLTINASLTAALIDCLTGILAAVLIAVSGGRIAGDCDNESNLVPSLAITSVNSEEAVADSGRFVLGHLR